MRRSLLISSLSVAALLCAFGTARAQAGLDADLGIALPEQPALLLEAPQSQTAQERAMVTGTVGSAPEDAAPSLRTGIPPVRRDAQGVDDRPEIALELPEPELPPLDPALAAPAAPMRAAAPANLGLPVPDYPVGAVEVPLPGLAEFIGERAPEAVALQRLSNREREDILAAYAANGNKPLWMDERGWSKAGKALVARLEKAGEDGLRPKDYPLPDFEASDRGTRATAAARPPAPAVHVARAARGGRTDPRRLSRLITPTLHLPSATEVLSELAGADDSGAALAAYNPPHEGYRRLKLALARARETQDDTPMVRIPAGPVPKIGMRDERVPLVRARLGLGPSDEPVFDRSTATAVAQFQRERGLIADGILGPQTIAALGQPVSAREESDILAQMERWRWLPPELGATHIFVNIPEYHVEVVRDGKVALRERTIVGKADSATPVFSHEMDHVVVNPSWFIPPSIMRRDVLPGLAADPDYAAKRGYVVTRNRNGTISVRQPPGERNALGWIKFMFPNDHAVYLHDTPNRRLFNTVRRAHSAGCVRVENPFKLADQVLGPEWTTERLRRLIGSGERTIRLPQKLPIHLAYNTLVADAEGALTRFEDIYGFHRLVRQALEARS